jgi:hypothetical protein
MPQQVHEETDSYRIAYDDEIDAVVFTWKTFASGEQFREGSNAVLEYFEPKATSKLIVDTSGIEAHDDEDQQWLEEVWTPNMIEAGLEYDAVVHPDSVIASMDTEEIMTALEKLPYEAFWTDDMSEAREWIAEK